jgi:uncharacterized protein
MQPITYLIFARTPRLNTVKTRLAATLGASQTLRLYEAMLTDTLSGIRSRNIHTVLLFAYPPESAPELALWVESRQLTFPALRILPQHGETLGDQMQRAFQLAENELLLPALILGTDSPTLPQHIWDEAENALQASNEAVLGRANDGGFYAMGLPKRSHSVSTSFFFGSDYSNNTVFERTQAALSLAFERVHALPEWTDIDDEASLLAVVKEASERQQGIGQGTEQGTEYATVRVCREILGGK